MPETTTPLTQNDVDAIEARANAATEGPWRQGGNYWDRNTITADKGDVFIADCGKNPMSAEFIAHAREDIPALIRDRRALKAEVNRVTKDRDELSDSIEACHKMFDELDPDIEEGMTSLTPLENRVREYLFPSDVITDDMVNGDD